MLSAEALNILTSCRFFSQVRGDSLERLLSMARVKRYARGTVIFRQGEPCPGVFILGAGLVRIFQTALSGKEHALHLVEPGQTFAEVAAIGGFPCPAHAAAIKDSICVLLPTGPFAQALREDHTLCLQIMSSMAFWVRHVVGLIEDIVLRDAAGRLARYLLEACGSDRDMFVLRSRKKDLASHLNLTSETLSRTLRRLVDAGLIEQLTGGCLRIVRREELERLADGLFPLL